MKMKFFSALIMAMLLVGASCSNDDDAPKPASAASEVKNTANNPVVSGKPNGDPGSIR